MSVSRLASNIRHLRKQIGISQEELATRLGGLNRGNIASYENETAEPKICNLVNLANFYKVTVIDLITVDLHCPIALKTARKNYQYELKKEDKVILEKYIEQAGELKSVIESVRVCQQFQVKTVKELPLEVQPVIANFNQLCNASNHLLKAHLDLLNFVKSRMK